MSDVGPDRFITSPCGPNAWYLTLTQRVGDYLTRAEQIAGRRDRDWTYLGIEFGGDTPRTWYPSTGPQQILIRLTESAANDKRRAIYQLAHEVMHLISPGGPDNRALHFEEGLCTWFQSEVTWSVDQFRWDATGGYARAEADIKALFRLSPSAIRDIRAIEPHMWLVTPEIVKKAVPSVSPDLAIRLCAKFEL